MRELTRDETALVAGGHDFADARILNAMLVGAGIGSAIAGPTGFFAV